MGSRDGVAESRLRSEGNLGSESRIGLDEVPGQISRILFGNNGGSSRPSYNPPGTGYGAPNSYFGADPSQPFYYNGYVDDLYFLVKLGQVALIIFIIMAVCIILALIITCCFSLFKKKKSSDSGPKPYIYNSQVTGKEKEKEKKRPLNLVMLPRGE